MLFNSKKFIPFIFTFIISVTVQAQSAANIAEVIPHWIKDEAHLVKIKTTTTDKLQGNAQPQTYVSAFDARFTVLSVNDAGYKVEWIYSKAELAADEKVIESQLVAKLLNQKLIIQLSDVGRFVELVNWEAIKTAADKAVDELIAGSAGDPTMNAQYRAAKQLVASKQGLEIAVLKQIKFYNFSFGFNYELNHIQTNNLKYPNPLGGQPFDAVEKVQLTKLDQKNTVCVIETAKTIDGKALKAAVLEYVKKATNGNAAAIEQTGKSELEMSESSMQEIDFSKGIVLHSFFKRTINFGFQNRTSNMEIETVK